MKVFVTIFMAALLVGCCTSRYCDPHEAGLSFQRVFGDQIIAGIDDTSNNVQAIGNYVEQDIKTSGQRIAGTAEKIYEGVSFARGIKGMAGIVALFDRQIKEGSENLTEDFRVICQVMCLCED